LGLDSLTVSTRAIESNDPRDQTYNSLERQLTEITRQRNALTDQMKKLLEDAEFKDQRLDDRTVNQLVNQANALLTQVSHLANGH
jgi:uncharacterized protein YoxC